MIGKIPARRRDGKSSFSALIAYCAGKEASRVIHTGHRNLLFPASAALEMEALATDNTRCKAPVFHMILSWREMELPTNEQADEAARIALAELGLSDCQALWILHQDTQNRHMHIVVNRIHPETGRAVIPANGWTKKALERAARKIELAQGWEIERSGRYAVTPEGEIIEKTAEREDTKLSQTARDVEAHTAAKSAERICQESAAPVIREAGSWGELHQRLADAGISFERKGSGAILFVDGVAVKASKAGRDISLSKLETRLGAYEPRDACVVVLERTKEPVERVTRRKVSGDWERYTAEREMYYSQKKEATAALAEHQKSERAALRLAQKQERESLYARSWKRMGDALNRRRSVMAASQRSANLNLRDHHKREREALKRRFPPRFPNFKTWLESSAAPESLVAFRGPEHAIIWSGEGGSAEPQLHDIRAFSPVVWNRGGVAYTANGGQEAQFIDYGRTIVLSEKCGEDAILAALQLANQKWGGAVVSGAEEYKRQCAALAIRHGLRISNPELAQEIEEGKKQQHGGNDMNIETKKEIFTRYAEAVGAERFRVTVTAMDAEKKSAFVFDRARGGYEGRGMDEVLDDLPKLSAYAAYGRNIIVTPVSPDKHHILVDDLTEERLRQLKDDGYSPACVIESSPGNFQAILTVPSVEDDTAEDRAAANRLTRELNLKYGDPKLSGSVHGHRLPPFENRKPKHRRDDGSFPETRLAEAKGGVCAKAREELEALHVSIREAEERARIAEATRRASTSSPGDPGSAYWIHYRDIAAKLPGPFDYSRIDGMIGVRMRVTGFDRNDVMNAIETYGPAMRQETMTPEDFDGKYRGRDWSRYARETTENYVFGVRGLSQYEKALEYRPYYLKLEGRDAARERENAQNQKRGR